MPKHTLVIAEAGVNHNGSRDLALQLIDIAAEAGADVVKFQTFKANRLVTGTARKAAYQIANTGSSESQLEMLRRLELTPDDHDALVRHCHARDIQFMSTAFDAESLTLLAGLQPSAVKIPSGDITCGPSLLQAARLRIPIIVSTGMSTLGEIEQALGVLAFGLVSDEAPSGRADFEAAYTSVPGRAALERYVTLLHCTTEYPAPAESVNLRAMQSMAAAFGLAVGYSDHTRGIEVPVAAVAMGASVIEKHFTSDRRLPGPDHAASLEPDELRAMVSSIRNVDAALGTGIKGPIQSELATRLVARRSIVAARPITRGEVITLEMLDAKRPGQGISPMRIWELTGTVAHRDYELNEAIDSPLP